MVPIGFVSPRVLLAGIASLAAVLAIATIDGVAQERDIPVTCTNPLSGASWRIVIDYGKSAVDSNPAKITPAVITWFDPKDGGNYSLDRQSGNLTASVASSTGGYFRYARCALEKSR